MFFVDLVRYLPLFLKGQWDQITEWLNYSTNNKYVKVHDYCKAPKKIKTLKEFQSTSDDFLKIINMHQLTDIQVQEIKAKLNESSHIKFNELIDELANNNHNPIKKALTSLSISNRKEYDTKRKQNELLKEMNDKIKASKLEIKEMKTKEEETKIREIEMKK